MPLGIWILNWDSSKVAANVMKILAEEVLGYNVEFPDLHGPNSLSAISAVGGCPDGVDCSEDLIAGAAEATLGRWHLAFEVWYSRAYTLQQRWERLLPDWAPTRLASIGYVGQEANHIRGDILTEVLNSSIALDWYRSYDTQFEAFHHLERFWEIDPGLLRPCVELEPQFLEDYHEQFPDDPWVRVDDRKHVTVECLNGTWWLSPACRRDMTRCVPFVGFYNWGMKALAHQAASYNLPIAIAHAFDKTPKSVVENYNILTYWWTPDSTFAHLDLRLVMFPVYNAQEYNNGLRRTQPQAVPLYNIAAKNLGRFAAGAKHMAAMMELNLDDMMDMLQDLSSTGGDHYQVACKWIHKNGEIWQRWKPDGIVCNEGQGLVDKRGEFLGTPEGAENCAWCQPGSCSQSWNLSSQTICVQCPPGAAQEQPGQDECTSCEAGQFAVKSGLTSCESCPLGTLAQGIGNTACQACLGEHETTQYLGASSPWECVCKAGYLRQNGHSEASGSRAQCAPCPERMICDKGNDAPTLQAGYWADERNLADRDFSIFRCRNVLECPGGPVGSCAPGRHGVGCAFCEPGLRISESGTCKRCEGHSAVLLLFAGCIALAIVCVIAVCTFRDVLRRTVSAISMGTCIGQLIIFMQAFQVFGMLKVSWAGPYKTVIEMMSYFTLNLDYLNASCFIEDSISNSVLKYSMSLLVYPAGLALLGTLFLAINVLTKRRASFDQMVNAVGSLTLMLFLLLTMQGFAPFHCIGNPNGSTSLASNPAIACYEDDWHVLAFFGGTALLLYTVCFMSWTIRVSCQYPRMVTSPRGMVFMTRYAFIFQRFTVDCFFFTPIYLLRSLLMNLFPIVFADYGHRQMLSLSMTFIAYISLIAWLKPLRGGLPNTIEIVIMTFFVVSLLCARLSFGVEVDILESDLGLLLWFALLTILCALVGIIGLLVWRSAKPSSKYVAFLCHHKHGCGVGARLVKLELEHHLRASVFLDCDNLEDLDVLLDMVRSVVDNLVIMLTAQTLSRPWCAGEIAAAFTNRVRMIPVAMDDYTDAMEGELTVENIAVRWLPEEFAACQRSGMSLETVREAYVHLQSLTKVPCPRVASCMSGDSHVTLAAIERVAALCRNERVVCGSEKSLVERKKSICKVKVGVGVVANQMDAEAISSAAVIAWLMRQQTQMQVVELLNPLDFEHAAQSESRPKSILVLLSEGALVSKGFSKMLLMVMDEWGDHLKVLPVSAEHFAFPTGQVLAQAIVPQVSTMLSRDREEIAAALGVLFATVAVKFSGQAQIATIRAEVAVMFDRLERQNPRDWKELVSPRTPRRYLRDEGECENDEPIIKKR